MNNPKQTNSQNNHCKDTYLWNNLDEKQKEELLIAYDESFDNNNLLTHEQVKLQHLEWLKPY